MWHWLGSCCRTSRVSLRGVTLADAGVEGPFRGRTQEAVDKQDLVFKDSFPGAIGVRIVEAREGYARAELTVDERVVNPGGIAHGGALSGFGDTVAAWATFPSLDPDEMFTTIDFKASFTAAAPAGTKLIGEGTVLHRGRRTVVIDVRISTDEPEPRLICVMIVTQAVMKSKAPAGRY